MLTIQFKRFEFGSFGSKITRRVEFGLRLDLQPYMSNSSSCGPQIYDLYAVLVHHGHSVHSGHYVCYVKASNGLWHICDDTRVGQVAERAVLGQQAYILFYVRRHPRRGTAGAAQQAAAAAAVAAARSGQGLSSVHSAGNGSAVSQGVSDGSRAEQQGSAKRRRHEQQQQQQQQYGPAPAPEQQHKKAKLVAADSKKGSTSTGEEGWCRCAGWQVLRCCDVAACMHACMHQAERR